MKTKKLLLAKRYLAALAKHVRSGAALNLKSARSVGVEAMRLGLETLDLARLHEEALTTLALPHDSKHSADAIIRRAGAFFAEAIMPIEEMHRGALEANAHLKKTVASLTERTVELAESNDELKREILQRKQAEASLRTSERNTVALLEKSRNMQEELRELSRRLLSVQEEERRSISRELHDVIAQTLTSINVRLATLKSQTTANVEELHKKIAITQRLVEKSVDIVHRFARDLRPSVLDDLGLVPALKSYIRNFTQETTIPVILTAYATVEDLDFPRRTVLYRIAQEALTNVARHSKAKHAKVSISLVKGAVRLVITDDGRGFQVDGAALARSTQRLGLLGMRERAEMVGGTFCVESAPGKKTSVRVDIPLTAAATPKKKSTTTTKLECP